MRKFAISLLVLFVLLVVVDRIGAAVAEHQVSDRVAAEYQLPAKPGVTIQGFPFLTQVIAGDYRQVDVSAGQFRIGRVRLTGLAARFSGVHASVSDLLHGNTAMIVADRAAGSAVIPFRQLAGWLPVGVKVGPDGRDLRVSGSVNMAGVHVPLSGTVQPSVTPGGIRVAPRGIGLPGGATLPVGAVGRLGVVIPVTNLPLHLRVASVSATPAGLRVGATARDVQFAGGG
jgi:hypothetical protein